MGIVKKIVASIVTTVKTAVTTAVRPLVVAFEKEPVVVITAAGSVVTALVQLQSSGNLTWAAAVPLLVGFLARFRVTPSA